MASVHWMSSEDDIQWLHEVHGVPANMKSAMIIGNEDAPEKIMAWLDFNPDFNTPPDFTKEPIDDGRE